MSRPGTPTPREWVGPAPFPWPAAHGLPDGAGLRACFCVVDVAVARTRQDQPYLRVGLTDRHGAVEGRVWNDALAIAATLRPGLYIGVQARVEYFNGTLQLCLDELQPLRVQLEDLELFLPRSRRSDADMAAELDGFIGSVADPAFRALLLRVLGAESEVGRAFRLAPAAKHNHHAFLGGLLEHTLSVAGACSALAAHYGAGIDRDLLLTAALLHDVGKVREIGARAGFPYTDEGKLLGHILLGLQMVHDAAADVPGLDPVRLLLLQHLIAAHQGRYEWQSPREPMVLEALLLHYADDLDAKLQQVRELMGRSGGGWTSYDRSLRRDFLQHLPYPLTAAAAGGEEAAAALGDPEQMAAGPGPLDDAAAPAAPGRQAPAEPGLPGPEVADLPAPEEPDLPGPDFDPPVPEEDDLSRPAPSREAWFRGTVGPRLADDTLDLFGEERP